MNQEILELLAEKKYSAVKQLIGQMEEADLAKLFEELENEEDADQFNRLFRLLPKETAAEKTTASGWKGQLSRLWNWASQKEDEQQ